MQKLERFLPCYSYYNTKNKRYFFVYMVIEGADSVELLGYYMDNKTKKMKKEAAITVKKTQFSVWQHNK